MAKKSHRVVISRLKAELKRARDSEYKAAQQWFFKEGINLIGVRVGEVRAIGRTTWPEVKKLPKQELFALCEELLKENLQELHVIAFAWARKHTRDLAASDFSVFERWLKKYVSNWAQCDGLCTGVLGDLLVAHPKLIAKTAAWRRSKNRWVRRAAAVSLIVPVKSKANLRDVFACATALLTDQDDMVQKVYGWMLKEASNVYPKDVFEFVMRHKAKMPRTALRYAIEKLPASKRKRAMA